MKVSLSVCLQGLGLFAMVVHGSAQEWTRFRGPNGAGVSHSKTIPARWTERDFNWKAVLPGVGHSSPVIWGDKVFITSAQESPGKVFVLCLNVHDGAVLWQREFPFVPFEKHKFNSFASATPTVDQELVYVCWNTPDRYTLVAFDHDGKTRWERNLGAFKSQHACGTSPILYRNKVILGNEQDGESSLLAVETSTGKTLWQIPRRTAVTAYSTPCVFELDGQRPVVIFNSQAHGISAIDPDEGKLVWEYAKAFDKRTVSSPVVSAGLIMGSCGSGGGGNYVVAIRPGDAATGKGPEQAYEIRKSAPYVPTSLAVGDLLYLWSDAGIVSCVHAPTGQVRWQERVEGDFFGSPVWVDGRLFCVSTAGDVVVVAASGEFQELARNPLGELSRTTPAVSGGRMYVRTASHLFSVGGKTKTVSLK